MIQFFKDRTGIITSDAMYPWRIQHKTPKDLLSFFITHGECSSVVIDGETFSLTVSDALPLFHTSHTASHENKTFSNLMSGVPCLSSHNFELACRMLWQMYSIPDTIITGPDTTMLQKVRQIQEYFSAGRGWKFEHVVCPQLKDEKKWRWFVADSRKSTAHYKKLSAGFSEICVFTPHWIVASLSDCKPVLA